MIIHSLNQELSTKRDPIIDTNSIILTAALGAQQTGTAYQQQFL